MANQENIYIETLKIITDFLSNNSWQILIFSILIICRNPIANLIGRMTNFSWRSGDSEIGVAAIYPEVLNMTDSGLSKAPEQSEKLADDLELAIKEEEASNQDWFSKIYEAFEKGHIKDAEEVFKEYAFNEKDPVKLEQNKAIYLGFLYLKGRDNNAVSQLENLIKTVTNEDSKYIAFQWLSFCYAQSSQIKSEIELWKKAIESFESEKYITNVTVNLAKSLIADDKTTEARTLLVSRLQEINSKVAKSILFSALSDVEKELGNKLMSVYCKDKSSEFAPENRDELFNSAYQASEEKINELSISNYVTLLRFEPNNAAALNNLGVCFGPEFKS